MRAIADHDLDLAAADLRASSPAFTSTNLLYALRRGQPERQKELTLQRFNIALARRLRRGTLEGLLAPGARRRTGRASAETPVSQRELDAYFPAAILLVDAPVIVDLFVATGAVVQSRIAVVCIDGTPAPVLAWLRRGLRIGHRAPIGYLHDARTVVYPFLCEPLATLARIAPGEPLGYRDLGIGPGVRLRDPLGLVQRPSRARSLEELPPASLVAYAAQQLLRMIPPDRWLSPLRESPSKRSAGSRSGEFPDGSGKISRSRA